MKIVKKKEEGMTKKKKHENKKRVIRSEGRTKLKKEQCDDTMLRVRYNFFRYPSPQEWWEGTDEAYQPCRRSSRQECKGSGSSEP